MRLFRCLMMILATLSMAAYPAAARSNHHAVAVHAHHHVHAANTVHDHRVAQAAHVADPCSGHHDRRDHDRGCCGNACCGPSCFSPAAASDGTVARASRDASMPRPGPDEAPRGTLFELLDRPPIAG